MVITPAPWDHQGVAMTVLIVDDHVEFRHAARLLLEAQEVLVVGEAPDGAGGLRAAMDLEPDVVLLDVMLPDVDGFTVADQMSALDKPPVVVLTSSRRRDDFGPRLVQCSARAFVHKGDLSGDVLVRLMSGSPS
ncbi:MAG: response regulator transcription factor [Actinomycetota bacterium]|nr:response regulator transcription factor [Actinomycetota bacterium]